MPRPSNARPPVSVSRDQHGIRRLREVVGRARLRRDQHERDPALPDRRGARREINVERLARALPEIRPQRGSEGDVADRREVEQIDHLRGLGRARVDLRGEVDERAHRAEDVPEVAEADRESARPAERAHVVEPLEARRRRRERLGKRPGAKYLVNLDMNTKNCG